MNSLFKKKSLDSILSSFTKVVEDLKVLQQDNAKAIYRNEAVINNLKTENLTLESESERASKVQDKINSLLE
jgi:hypothetical protein